MNKNRQLVWKDEYSVNVIEIDDQHKQLFDLINQLDQMTNSPEPNEASILDLINQIVQNKVTHFATEEKYFHQFNFAETADHEAMHRQFNQKAAQAQTTFQDDVLGLGNALVDYVGKWLIDHLVFMDRRYQQCFNEHGLY